jgi:hypothetical protein
MDDSDLFDEIYDLIKEVNGLHTLGFNEGRMEGRPRGTKDESGTTAATYRKHAKKLQSRITRMREKLRIRVQTRGWMNVILQTKKKR